MTPAAPWASRPVWIFDQADTLMFEANRFGPTHDYHTTYRMLGGSELCADSLREIVDRIYAAFAREYGDPARVDLFPRLPVLLECEFPGWVGEHERLSRVFAHHEAGTFADDVVKFLRRLKARRRLAMISNIWAEADHFEALHREVGLADLFEAVTWSSRHGSIKPSPRIFRDTLAMLRIDPGDAVYIGDNFHRDVVPAQALGMATVWVNPENLAAPSDSISADAVVSSVFELEDYLFH
jgi:HAD superfamily hydrolase (TIGR01509 family)